MSFDEAWPERRLAVELDSGYHDTPTARRRDAERDADAAGWTVVRLREEDLHRPLPDFILDIGGNRSDPG